MKNIIYYFSATGNSLSVAKKIQEGLEDTELRSISTAIQENAGKKTITVETVDRIGFVFPVYAWGMPRIVEEFVENLEPINVNYAFAIATCGGTPGKTLIEFNQLLAQNNFELDAGFTVTEGAYTFLEENFFMKIIPPLSGKEPLSFNKRQEDIMGKIINKEKHTIESSFFLGNALSNKLHGFAIENFKASDQDFWVNENCNNCNTCVDICPRENIKIVSGEKIWQKNCEFCFACVMWCPNNAIEYQQVSINQPRVHNNNIKITDLLEK